MYNDGLIDTSKFEQMAKEYSLVQKSQILKTGKLDISQDEKNLLFVKIEYLKVLTGKLKNLTKNANILQILGEILQKIDNNSQILIELLGQSTAVQTINQTELTMFCNNLKLAINTTGDIIKLLVKIKTDDQTFELSPSLTKQINSFIEINNEYVSLFGECQYLRYGK